MIKAFCLRFHVLSENIALMFFNWLAKFMYFDSSAILLRFNNKFIRLFIYKFKSVYYFSSRAICLFFQEPSLNQLTTFFIWFSSCSFAVSSFVMVSNI